MRYFFRVEYDGTAYGGWQVQPNADSIQAQLEKAFSTVTRAACSVVGAGRTDAGVHARGQGAHVDGATIANIGACEIGINALLPRDIAIYGLREIDDGFHARFSAIKRTYRYSITTRKSPLSRERAWSIRHHVDWDKVRAALPHLLGPHDFTTFCSADTTTENMACSIVEASLNTDADPFVLTIAADRFVYKMVRSLVGTLIDIGRGRITTPLAQIIDSRDRSLAGTTAPAWGLVLDHVDYPGGI
jgi:tRNA pseudouridine38-40 synthase